MRWLSGAMLGVLLISTPACYHWEHDRPSESPYYERFRAYRGRCLMICERRGSRVDCREHYRC
jgi:hypothetical protein